jgi:hypothetical protein
MNTVGHETNTNQPKKRFWRDYEPAVKIAITTLGFTAIYSLVTIGLYLIGNRATITAQKQLELSERPWIGIRAIDIESLTYDSGDPTKPVFRLRYQLENIGHSAGSPGVFGNIIMSNDRFAYDLDADTVCDKATKPGWRPEWTIIPNSGMIYDVVYDGQHDDFTQRDHSPQFKIDPQRIHESLRLTNVGCILYRSTIDNKIHQTPFVAQISMLDSSGKPPRPSGQLPISFSNRPSAEKLCVIDVLLTGEAN